MKDERKTREQLIYQLNEMRHIISEYRNIAGDVWHDKPYQHTNNQDLQNDLTGLKHVNSQAEVIFSKAFYCNPDIMTITTLKEGRFIAVNDTFEEITGYRRHEAIGHTVYELDIWPITKERDYMMKKIQEDGKIRGFEHRFRTKYGEIRTFRLSAEIIDTSGETLIIVTSRDITENKRMEEALRLSEERFAKAFNVCPIPTIITTLAEGKIINANDSFIKMYGFNQEEILGKTTSEIFWFDPADRSLLTKRIIEEGSFRETEVIFQRKPGEKRLGLLSAELLNINGTPCILGVCKDITELRKMETNLARLDRLNLVGEMAASIGHEIRNPMTTVRGYLQILRDGKDYTQATEYFDLMIEELDRANSIITEFLSLAKNKMVELKTGNLNSIIIKLLPLIESKAIGRDHNIKLELHDIPDLLIDKEEIHQLVFNLVDNGLESMSSAGVVTIRTFMENEQVVLAVQDQGHGIDRRLLDKLGTPFLTTKEQGTGLGLAVCYRIAARHNAEIDIVTNSTGTTFYVKFLIPMGATMAGCKTS